MADKSKDDMYVWAEFIQQLDQTNASSKVLDGQNPPESGSWKQLTVQINSLNHHRDAYVLHSQPKHFKKKPPHILSQTTHVFQGVHHLDETVPHLDRDDKKHLTKVMSHQMSVVDLHGCTLAQGYEKLKLALSHALQKKSKILKVITGKGRPNPEPESPTLRSIFPKWMQEHYFKAKTYKVRMASIPHGGEGAFLVYLKYPKS